jgi:mannose-1-phosphate guanylyltransferase
MQLTQLHFLAIRPVIQQNCLASIDVYVLAGGLGTRIRPALGDTPKLLAPIGGQPYLRHLFDWLRQFGARRIVLGLGHGAAAVLDYLRAQPATDVDICTVVEPSPLGTAGAIRFARAELRSDPVLVLNGDTFVNADLCALVARQRETRALGTLVCVDVDDAGRYGRVVLDAAGRIIGFTEKDTSFRGPAAVNGGVSALSAELLDRIAIGEAKSLEYDVFQRLPAGSLAAYPGRFDFIDIGTPESLARAADVFGAAAPAAGMLSGRS